MTEQPYHFDNLYTPLLVCYSFFIVFLLLKIVKGDSLFSPGFFFLVAWTTLLNFTIFIEKIGGLYKPITQISVYYIIKYVVWSGFGLLIANIVPVPSINQKKYSFHLYDPKLHSFIYYYNKYSKILFVFFLILSMSLLINKIVSTRTFSLSWFYSIRLDYLERKSNTFDWFLTHISNILLGVLIVSAAADAITENKFDIKKIVLFTLVTAPLGLSKGGRGYLFSGLIHYSITYLSCIKPKMMKKYIKTNISILLFIPIVLVILSFVFASFGELRESTSGKFYIDVMAWISATVAALDSWISMAATYGRTNGGCIFNWFFVKLHSVGLTSTHSTFPFILCSQELALASDTAWSIPPSMIPGILFDFGKSFFGLIAFTITFVFEYTSRIFSQSVLIHSVIRSFLSITLFWTIQQIYLFGSSSIVLIFWPILLILILPSKPKTFLHPIYQQKLK
ncbi:MAG: O-antigen polymerase [candidate division WOR-3 bacterium]